ncbi:MAG TPA: methyl-accepting chemotaxis protein [Bacteroidota bacterium]|nr:methyl-accepting chemotaxis protein [Bacteroidota bacterium]
MKAFRLTFRLKLILITLVFVVVPVLVLGYFSYQSSVSSMESVVSSDLTPVVRLALGSIQASHDSGRPLAEVEKDLLSVKLGSTGYIYGMDSKGNLLIHPTMKGKSVASYDFAQQIMARAVNLRDDEVAVLTYDWINKEIGETSARQKIAAFGYYKPLDMIVVAGSYTDEFTDAARGATARAILLVAVASIAISVVTISIFSKRISHPIVTMRDAAAQVATGDLTESVPVTSNDEIGDLGRSFNEMVAGLRDTLFTVGESSASVASASSQISSSTEELAAGAQEQTSQASEVASAVEEMTKTIVENSKNASNTADTARKAKEAAQQGGKVVEDTVVGMKRIAEVVNKSAQTVRTLGKSSEQIGEIIGVIDDIADQTNLLALNAAIEAARAGEQGRGFAVVADEVRKLAERTTKATKEIAGMIKTIQSDTQGAVNSMEEGTREVTSGIELADRAGASLKEIVSMIQTLTDMVSQIAAASEEQSSASEQISKNVEGISSVTSETAQGTQQIAKAAEDLNRLTEGLQQLVGKFRLAKDEASVSQRRSPAHPRHTGPEKSKIAVRQNGALVSHN